MSSPEETVITLLDSYWFDYGVFSPKPSLPKTTPILHQFQEETQVEEAEAEKPRLSRITTQMRKSLSDQFLSSKDCSDSSPNSVLIPQLQTIFSSKEVENFPDSNPNSAKFFTETERHGRNRKSIGERKSKKRGSRSMSELEIEELKGFMDLGFVFSDEDMDSNLVSIIPGLQRLGKNCRNGSESEQPLLVSRPYLSEAWDCMEDEEEKRKRNNPLTEWRIPAFGNETELKNHLRFWAQTVASTVR